MLAAGAVLPYLVAHLGFHLSVVPTASAIVCLAAWAAAQHPETIRVRGDGVLALAVVCLTLGLLLSRSWPGTLPPGGGSDLTHHLQLVDTIATTGRLVHDPHLAAVIGEMAAYTPGVHVLAVLAGRVARVDPLFTMYPVVAVMVALKFGLFALCLRRVLRADTGRDAVRGTLLLMTGLLGLIVAAPFTLWSFLVDSFVAQVAAELFAVGMWWTLLAWDDRPSTTSMSLFAALGAATFLTWPVWVGPPVLTAVVLILWRRDLTGASRLRQLAIGLGPLAVVALLHAAGRAGDVSLVRSSGAVSLPSFSQSAWWLLPLALIGLARASRQPGGRAVVVFTGAVLLQAGALWVLAERAGSTTPYMALKMSALLVYPLLAAVIVSVATLTRGRMSAVAAVLLLGLLAARFVNELPRPAPVVASDLWAAGVWAREHVPPDCVDYLVDDEYTAYWLHLAVLRNPRAAARSTDNDTYLTQPAMARWLVDEGWPPYAIARVSRLPAEIRERTRVLHRVGDAAVIVRGGARGSCP